MTNTKNMDIQNNKSANRVSTYYKVGSKEWQEEYDMLLPDNITCKECKNCSKCVNLFGSNETDTMCQWYPSKFNVIS